MIVLPMIQETSTATCDQGLPLAELREEVARNKIPIDLSLLHEDWNVKVGFGLFTFPMLLKWALSVCALTSNGTARTHPG